MDNLISFLNTAVHGALGNKSEDRSLPEELKLHEPFTVQEPYLTNGLCFNNIYLPPEIVTHILSYVEPKQLLRCTRLCKQWCNLIKSPVVWQELYNRLEYPKKANNWPWYIFYCYFTTENFTNLIKNGNGQNKFAHWKINNNGGDKFKIEDPPSGSPSLPLDVSDFNGFTSCFSTSYQWCNKVQVIQLSKLMRYIIRHHKPSIYASEWYNGRFDCACVYVLSIKCVTPTELPVTHEHCIEHEESSIGESEKRAEIEQWSHDRGWEKMEIIMNQYPADVVRIQFRHAGKDKQFWAGHYGSKMAGGVVKFLIDSIKPESNENTDICDEIM